MADDKKVFDVTSLGKVKAEPTAKPVIIGHKVPVSDGTTSKTDKDQQEKAPVDPLTEKSDEPALKVNESKLSPVSEKKIEPSDELVKEVEQEKEKPAEKASDKGPESEPSEPEAEKPDKDEEVPKKDDLQKDDKPASEPAGNEQAVNTVLGDAGSTKQAEVEALEKQEKVKKLVDDGKYSLSIGQPRKHHGKIKLWQGVLIIIGVFLITIAGFALAVDAEIIKSDYKLPFDLIKKSQTAENGEENSQTTKDIPIVKEPVTVEKTACYAKDANSSGLVICNSKDLKLSFSYPKEWGDFTYNLTEVNDQDKNKHVVGKFTANKKMVIGMVTPKYEAGADGACYAVIGLAAQDSIFKDAFPATNAKDSTSEVITKDITRTDDKVIIEQYQYYNFDSDDFEGGLGMCPGLSFAGAVQFIGSEFAGVQFSWTESENYSIQNFKTTANDLSEYKTNPNLTLSAVERKKILDFINSLKAT